MAERGDYPTDNLGVEIFNEDGRSSVLNLDSAGFAVTCSCGWSIGHAEVRTPADAMAAYDAHVCVESGGD